MPYRQWNGHDWVTYETYNPNMPLEKSQLVPVDKKPEPIKEEKKPEPLPVKEEKKHEPPVVKAPVKSFEKKTDHKKISGRKR